MISNIVLLNITQVFERMAYYGLRSIVLLFLINQIGLESGETAEYYGYFTTGIYFLSVLGGLIVDFSRRPVLVALIANCLSTAGIFTLAVAENGALSFAGASLAAIGFGFYKPAVFSVLYSSSYQIKHRFDFILSIFYFCVNIGAFLAPLVVTTFGMPDGQWNYPLILIIIGCISLVPTIVLSVNYKNFTVNDLLRYNDTYTLTPFKAGNLVLCMLGGLFFWTSYELFQNYSAPWGDDISSVTSMILLLGASIVIIPLNLIRGFGSGLKIGIGLFMMAAVLAILPHAGYPQAPGLITLSTAEWFVAPIIMSLVIRQSSPRFTGTMLSLYLLVSWITNRLVSFISDPSFIRPDIILGILAVICAAVAGGIITMEYFQKKAERNLLQ